MVKIHKITDNDLQLFDINFYAGYEDMGRNTSFYRGDLRSRVSEIFDIDSTFQIFRTTANPKADEALKTIKTPNHPWTDHKSFNDDVMKAYLHALEEILEKKKIHAIHYQSVNIVPPANYEHDTTRWPIWHIVKGDVLNRNTFMDVVKNLHDAEAFEIMEKKEKPHNYYLEEITLLHEEQIPPLIIKYLAQVTRKELKLIVDLSQFRMETKECSLIDL